MLISCRLWALNSATSHSSHKDYGAKSTVLTITAVPEFQDLCCVIWRLHCCGGGPMGSKENFRYSFNKSKFRVWQLFLIPENKIESVQNLNEFIKNNASLTWHLNPQC